MRVSKIRRELLEFVFKVASSNYPKEFSGILRAKGDVIEEVLFLPGTLSSSGSSVMMLNMLPIDRSVCGTVHSHPSEDHSPSPADLHFFGKFGNVHIIVAHPYDFGSWKAFSYDGDEIELEVIQD